MSTGALGRRRESESVAGHLVTSRVVPLILALLVTTTYLLLALIAYSRYPSAFSPQNNNWLSDLGNRDLNADGAVYYNAGCMSAGALAILFYLSLRRWSFTGTHIQNRLLFWVQVAGALAGTSLVMSAIFPIDRFDAHQFWSRVMFSAFATTLFCSFFALRRPGRSNGSLLLVTALAYALLPVSIFFGDAHWLEWISVALILAYVNLVGWKTLDLREP